MICITSERFLNIENKTHLKHWLIRATLNRCKNHFKTFWKQKVHTYGEFYFETSINFESESIECVRNLISELPKKHRDVVYLYYYEDYSTEEISDILEIAIGTVKSRLYNARKALKSKLTQGGSYEI